jgi:excisionase family DNA binding protein
MEEKHEMMTIEETARLLRITRQTLYERTKKKEIPAYKVGRRVLYKREDIEKFLNQHKSS